MYHVHEKETVLKGRIYQICLKYDLKRRILSVTLKWHLKRWTLIEIRIYQLEIARTLN